VRQAEAGARLGVTRANVSGLVHRLTLLGLCRVETPSNDARAKLVRATRAGARLLARLQDPWHARLMKITRGIPVPLQHRMADAAEGLAPAAARASLVN
jgi:DNA-binding MarR family transcriptional regulator